MSAREARPIHSETSAIPRVPGSRESSRVRELVAIEDTLKAALGPFAREARAKGIELVCELVPGVGDSLVASRRALVTALVRAMSKAFAWPDVKEIRVRLARQRAGFALSDTVLLTVTGDRAPRAIHSELSMPIASEGDDERVVDGARLLVIAPSSEAARVMVGGARRAGAAAQAVSDPEEARSALREARADGKGFDMVVIDDALESTGEFIDALRDDASLGGPPSVVATVPSPASGERTWVARGATAVLDKPVLPADLGSTLASVLMRGPRGGRRRGSIAPPPAPPSEESSTRIAAQAAQRPSVLDLPELRTRAGGDEAFVRDLLSDFLTHSAGWSATLREACESGAFAEAGRLTHRLRGALGALGAKSASQAAEAVERRIAVMVGTGAVGVEARARLASALPDLERRLDEVRAVARAHLSSLPAAPSR